MNLRLKHKQEQNNTFWIVAMFYFTEGICGQINLIPPLLINGYTLSSLYFTGTVLWTIPFTTTELYLGNLYREF